jgi:hypothetical protein
MLRRTMSHSTSDHRRLAREHHAKACAHLDAGTLDEASYRLLVAAENAIDVFIGELALEQSRQGHRHFDRARTAQELFRGGHLEDDLSETLRQLNRDRVYHDRGDGRPMTPAQLEAAFPAVSRLVDATLRLAPHAASVRAVTVPDVARPQPLPFPAPMPDFAPVPSAEIPAQSPAENRSTKRHHRGGRLRRAALPAAAAALVLAGAVGLIAHLLLPAVTVSDAKRRTAMRDLLAAQENTTHVRRADGRLTDRMNHIAHGPVEIRLLARDQARACRTFTDGLSGPRFRFCVAAKINRYDGSLTGPRVHFRSAYTLRGLAAADRRAERLGCFGPDAARFCSR